MQVRALPSVSHSNPQSQPHLHFTCEKTGPTGIQNQDLNLGVSNSKAHVTDVSHQLGDVIRSGLETRNVYREESETGACQNQAAAIH